METNNQSSRVSSYLEYLPASLQADPFLGRFLLAFEQILSGLSSAEQQYSFPKQHGLEQEINRIHTYFNPGTKADSDTAQSEFLPWLAGWVALSLRDEWTEETKRQFIRQVVPLYRRRGTRAGLEKILELYLKSSNLPEKVEVFEFDAPPHYFQVQLTLPDPDMEKYWRQARIAKAIIDQEKPAHTYYGLKILVPTMRITGNVYPISLEKPGTIVATVSQTNTPKSSLRLSIKANLGQPEPNVQKIGSSDSLEVTYEVAQQQTEQNNKWYVYVIVNNLSDSEVKLNLTVYYPQPISNEGEKKKEIILEKNGENLQRGLRIFQIKEKKPTEGNTMLGTDTGLKREPSKSSTK
ncbi:phage tail protein I [Microcoleus vaginatus]|uniref:phage tail protein I n=1 Tax=Microcoleus vaginatus TaxID=119532 RepID=UPI001686CCD6|nr:phage tail protein I [Microcoleus sp. FACHB-84]